MWCAIQKVVAGWKRKLFIYNPFNTIIRICEIRTTIVILGPIVFLARITPFFSKKGGIDSSHM